MGEVLQKDESCKQVKKNATKSIFERFAGRNEASGKPASCESEN